MKCLNVSNFIRLSEIGARKSEDVLPKFGVRPKSLRSQVLSKLRSEVVTVSPSYVKTLEAVSPKVAYLFEANAVRCKQKNDFVPYCDPRDPQKLSKNLLEQSRLRACSV